MPLKIDGDGNPVIQDGKPVWINPLTAKESPFDPDEMHAKTLDLGREAKTHRERADELAETMAALKAAGVEIDNPEAVSESLKRLRALEREAKRNAAKAKAGGDGEGAAEHEELRAKLHELEEALEGATGRADKAEKEATDAATRIRKLTVGSAFQRSKFFAPWKDPETDEMMDPLTVLPPEVAESYLGQHFEPNGDGVHGFYEPGGGKPHLIYSREKEGAAAPFDEALERLLERMPTLKTQILRKSSPGSLGATGGDVSAGGAGSMSRAAFEKLPHDKRDAHLKAGGTVV